MVEKALRKLEWQGPDVAKKGMGQEWQVSMESDASSSWGCGVIWGAKWLQVQCQGLEGVAELNITIKELLPIILAAAIWGRGRAGKLVRARCDNMAVGDQNKQEKGRHASAVVPGLLEGWGLLSAGCLPHQGGAQ